MPQTVKYSPRPLCHATDEATWLAFQAGYKAVVEAYKSASKAFRAGVVDVVFPPNVFFPPLPHAWRGRVQVAAAA
jgi:hypothetical protein